MPLRQPVLTRELNDRGRAAIERAWKEQFAESTFKDWSAATSSYRADGHLAYGGGTERFASVEKNTGKADSSGLQFLVVVREQPNKQWVVVYGMEAPPPPKPK